MLIALDQGTTNTKALVLDREGRVVFQTSGSAPLHRSAVGHIQQDPEALWESARTVLLACTDWARAHARNLYGLCLTNQRETAIAWDRTTGKPLAPAISWQCRRSSSICAELQLHAEHIRELSGLPLDPLLSATKWAWMLRHEPRVAAAANNGTLALGTVDSWLLFRLTAGALHATDTTNASRTGVLNLEHLRWDERLLNHFGLRPGWLPRIQPSASHFGEIAAATGLPTIPIVAVAGDSHAAMLGHGDLRPGAIKSTYGTGSSLMALTSAIPNPTEHLARTVAWSLPSSDLRRSTQYAVEANITMSGAALEWAGLFLGLDPPADSAAQLAQQVSSADGLVFVPAMAGLGAPHWRSDARGTITGLLPHHRGPHLARAALDAIAFQVADVVDCMRVEAAIAIHHLLADGGATRNSCLMQLQSDILGIPVLRSSQEELSALGVARLGGLTLGWWPELAAAHVLDRGTETFTPAISTSDRESRLAAWHAALRRTLLEVAR